MKVELSVSWALGQSTAVVMDGRLPACLEAIDAAGSLAAAARHSGISYRHLWGLLVRWEQQCGSPLVRLQRGRGAQLTPLGKALLETRERIQSQLAAELERLADEAGRALAETIEAEQQRGLKIVASHDLSLGVLRELMSSKTGLPVEMRTQGSLDALRALSAGHCDIAGFHVSAPLLGTAHLARLRDCLDVRRHQLIRLLSRRQGLIVAQGNPLQLSGLGDVAEHRARFINRQPGSGTRLLVDVLLEKAGIRTVQINGYANEEFTHLAVAAMVASGAADAGFGIEAAARQFALGFVPVVTEQYWLAVNTGTVSPSQLQTLSGVLRSDGFHRRIQSLAGYDSCAAGAGVPESVKLMHEQDIHKGTR